MCSGRLLWRRFVHLPPSHHAIRTTCMQLLPLVEMYCKWELEEDCTSLRALVCWFDSELELESHEPGRSLLSMIQDDDVGLISMARRPPTREAASLFHVIWERLAAFALAIRDLHPQVHMLVDLCSMCELTRNCSFPLNFPMAPFPYCQRFSVWH